MSESVVPIAISIKSSNGGYTSQNLDTDHDNNVTVSKTSSAHHEQNQQQRVEVKHDADTAQYQAKSKKASPKSGEDNKAFSGYAEGYVETQDGTSEHRHFYASSRQTTPVEEQWQEKLLDLNILAAADSLMCTHANGSVLLRTTQDGPGAAKPVSVASVFADTVKRLSTGVALATKVNNEWKKWTWTEYYTDVLKAAKGFIKLGLEPYHSVGILGFNAPEWHISNIGAMYAGYATPNSSGFTHGLSVLGAMDPYTLSITISRKLYRGLAVGIYTTNSADACKYIASDSRANIIVVEDQQQLKKILEVRDQLPDLKAIVQYRGEVLQKGASIYTWDELMKMHLDIPDTVLNERMSRIAPNKCCALIYTSGTTGDPKGVMVSHDNLTWTARYATHRVNLNFGQETIISYLPLSHVAAQLLDIHVPMLFGATVYFAQPDALRGSLKTTLAEVRPTIFFGVPRVWEKFQEAMQNAALNVSSTKKKIAAWAKRVGLKGNYAMLSGRRKPLTWGIANALVFKKVRVALGLDRCRFCVIAAAPVTKQTLEYFLSLNIPLYEVYGMSETSGPHTVSDPVLMRVCSVGVEFPGAETKLTDVDADGNGEICMRGRHLFMGYLNQPEKTRETMDAAGWLKSGDIGKKDKDGFMYITGRIKELLITAGGENIAPVTIEDAVKLELPVVSNCMLIGDKKKFLSLLVTLKVEINDTTMEPTDKLTSVSMDWCQSVGSNSTHVSEIVHTRDANVIRAIQAGIDRANAKAVSRAAKIQKWSLLLKDFSVPGGELGPSMKLRRPIMVKMYQNTIAQIYAE